MFFSLRYYYWLLVHNYLYNLMCFFFTSYLVNLLLYIMKKLFFYYFNIMVYIFNVIISLFSKLINYIIYILPNVLKPSSMFFVWHYSSILSNYWYFMSRSVRLIFSGEGPLPLYIPLMLFIFNFLPVFILFLLMSFVHTSLTLFFTNLFGMYFLVQFNIFLFSCIFYFWVFSVLSLSDYSTYFYTEEDNINSFNYWWYVCDGDTEILFSVNNFIWMFKIYCLFLHLIDCYPKYWTMFCFFFMLIVIMVYFFMLFIGFFEKPLFYFI